MPPKPMNRRDAAEEARRLLAVRKQGFLQLAQPVEPEHSPEEIAAVQYETAMEGLYSPVGTVVRFPYESLHAMSGRLTAGQLVFVMANTGQGKTTFLLDLTDRWAEAGVHIDYLGTEQEPHELITKWACLRADVPPGVAIGKEWDDYTQGEGWRELVAEQIAKIEEAYSHQVVFSPDKFITLRKIEQAAAAAEQRGAHVLIVDHIDRVDVGKNGNEYEELKALVRRLKELARDHKLVLLVASQMNREGRKESRLGAYHPPLLHQMQGGGTKEQEADMVLGLWRPLRPQHPDESPEKFKALRAAAAAGDIKPTEVIEPNTMAVVLLKHRTYGNREGERCKLHVQHGRITNIPERDRHGTSYDETRRL